MKLPVKAGGNRDAKKAKVLLRVDNLKKYFPIRAGVFSRVIGQIRAVDGVSFDLYEGETLGIVGESGCGKSTAGKTILRLLEPTSGKIEFQNHDISTLRESDLRPLRREMQMIFQDPYASLNPKMTVGKTVAEPIVKHKIFPRSVINEQVEKLFEEVGLNPQQMSGFPHQFSGGQRQRVAIARALAVRPKLIICDEPVSALDISIQAQIINLLIDIQKNQNLALIFISHDLAVVDVVADKIAVMYLGEIVEIGSKQRIISNPKHPYTEALISAVPVTTPAKRRRKRIVLTGDVPSPANPPTGCRFHLRCPIAKSECRNEKPKLISKSDGHAVACHLRN